MLCTDLSSFLGDPYVGQRASGVPHLAIPRLSDIPVVGPILFDQNLSVYGSFVIVAAAYFFIFRTRRAASSCRAWGSGRKPRTPAASG